MRYLAQRSRTAGTDAISGRRAVHVPARMRAAYGSRALRRDVALGLVVVVMSATLGACGSAPPAMAPGTASVVSAPARIAHTKLGAVGYRVVGHGPPLVLIMGYDWTMEGWDPRLIHALARHNRVVMFDNSGVGRTQPMPGEQTGTLTVDAMADQTSALIDTLGLSRPGVLGWSMGGMVAQALAVLHPAQVRRLVLCATYPGTGAIAPPSLAALRTGSDFPANQVKAYDAFKAAIAEYPAAPPAPIAAKTAQAGAVANWWDGSDPTGRKTTGISVPTLVADGTDDRLDPAANDHTLARLIPGARLVLYPDAGHGFLFQDGTRFASLVSSFLTGHPGS
jgi:pimeloyl-ACP methyl ester carboxylesterase